MSIEPKDNFIIEDGHGHLFNIKSRKLMTLYVDNVGAPLESCRDFTMMTKDCKEKLTKKIKDSDEKSIMEVDTIQTKTKRNCLRYSFEIKQKFHEMTEEEGFSAYLAANILGVPKQTAYT